MAGQESAQPLLSDQDIITAWESQDVDSESAQRISSACNVEQMFEEHPHDVLKFLQTSGVERLAEFTAMDDMVFGAFKNDAILTFGSDQRWLTKEEAESQWRHHLESICKKRGISTAPVSVQRRQQPQGMKSPRRVWSKEVAVEAFVVTIKDAAAPVEKGLLHPLIQEWQAKRCSYSVFTLPAVQSVIQYKWKAFARRLLVIELSWYCLWLTSYYTFCAAMQDEDLSLPFKDLLITPRGRVTVAAEIISLLAMTPFLMVEAGSIAVYGMGWLRDPANALDTCTYLLQIAIAVMHFGRIWLASNWLTYCLAVQCILLMFRLQYFTQALRPTRFSFSTVVKEVIKETGWVFMFVFLTCIAFGAAFHISFRTQDNDKTPEEFSSFIRSVLASFEHIYGDIELKDFVNSNNPFFNTCLALSFILIMGYCLVNLLLGMILNSLDRVLEHEGAKQLCNQARLINEMETAVPSWYERKKIQEWHPKYVHVLRIDPKKLDAIEMDKLWSKHGEFAPVMQAARGGDDEESSDDGGGGGGGGGKDAGGWDSEEEGIGSGTNKVNKVEGTSDSNNKNNSALMSKLDGVEKQLEQQRAVLERLEARLQDLNGQNSIVKDQGVLEDS